MMEDARDSMAEGFRADADGELERDSAFDQRIHDAYGSVELSPESEARILSALLAAQAARDAEPAAEPSSEPTVEPGPAIEPDPVVDSEPDAIPFRKRSRAGALIPIAASLLLAFVIGRAVLPSRSASPAGDSAAPAQTQQDSSKESGGSEEGEAIADAEPADAAEPSQNAATPGTGYAGETALSVDVSEEAIRSARFDDGRLVDFVFENGAPVVVESDGAGRSLGTGHLLDPSGAEGVRVEFFACDPYPYASDGFCLIRIEDDSAYYLARIAG